VGCSLVIGYFLWSKTKDKSKKKFPFPTATNALNEAKEIMSGTIPVSREELKSAITRSKMSSPVKGGSNKGKRKTHKKRK
jgi:hypothetical protein